MTEKGTEKCAAEFFVLICLLHAFLFFTLSLPSPLPSSDLKDPINNNRTSA